jgi:gas vesicle protein
MDHLDHEHATPTNQLGGLLAGLLVGGLAGAGAMLLLAPQSGKRTRTQIQLRGMELKDQATDAMDDAMAQTRHKAHQIRTGARGKMEKFQHRAQILLEKQKTHVSTVVGAGKHAVLGSA